MNIPINLASQPFRRDRPIIVGAAVLGILMLGLLGLLITLTVSEKGLLKNTARAIGKVDGDLRGVATEQARLDAVLRKPENAEVLERSIFLNSLIYRKGISWTKIFADLEKTLPYNVRVTSIHPAVNPMNQVTLEMNVGAEQTEPLLELLMRLENSELFGRAAVANRIAPSQTEPLYRYKVNVNYAQRF